MSDPNYAHEFNPSRKGSCKQIVSGIICGEGELAQVHVNWIHQQEAREVPASDYSGVESDEVKELRRGVEEVLALHRHTPEMQWGNVCCHCFKNWPCPTVNAIKGEKNR